MVGFLLNSFAECRIGCVFYGREVAIVDIPNAFIETVVEDEKDRAFIRIRGPLVNIMVSIAPDVYGPYVTVGKKGKKQLLVKCLMVLWWRCYYCLVWATKVVLAAICLVFPALVLGYYFFFVKSMTYQFLYRLKNLYDYCWQQ